MERGKLASKVKNNGDGSAEAAWCLVLSGALKRGHVYYFDAFVT